ncbi:MAG: transaldolase [Trueperaceae bacterium]|nr:transaldolase [Trueperaceae bacterium]
MNFWLASANPRAVETHLALGIWRGVITNPAVVAAEGRAPRSLFTDLIALVPRAWYQLRDASADAMLAEADDMLSIDSTRIGIKVPATNAGLGVLRTLADQGLEPMATAVPTATWMTFAVAAGATMIAPYGGMLQRAGVASKHDEIARMQEIIDEQGYDVDLCTGIYDATEIPLYARLGVRACFVWERDVVRYFTQPLVAEACEAFRGDWEAIAAAIAREG